MSQGRPTEATYKRSWKNYLLNTRYQLRFTLFMVAIAGLLMYMLAWGVRDPRSIEEEHFWPTVMSEAESATKVGVITIQGATLDYSDAAKDDHLKREKIAALKAQEMQLEVILVALVLVLCSGLFMFGILMTHKVAGPLHKIGLYLDKVRDGKYTTVYNLRKGDQLMEFFDHFKEAHATLRRTQEKDVQALRDLIAAAEKGDAARSPQLAAALDELRALLASKEAGLV
jgi:hypothetical protein